MNMDQAILNAFPLLAVPSSGLVPPAGNHGMRYLVGRTGIAREINLPWLRARHHVALSAVQLPYGEVSDQIDFKCGPIPREVIRKFAEEAKAAAPTEIAAAFIWSEQTGQWRYARREATSAGADHINFVEVNLVEGESLVVDVHSHGYHPAYFSRQDDSDDMGTMRISLVLGNLQQDVPASAMRLCLAGFVYPASIGADGNVEVHL